MGGGVWLLATPYWKGDSHLKYISARGEWGDGGEGETTVLLEKDVFAKTFV